MAPSRRRRVDGVARGAESTSSAKRAKVDEAKEEEDPLVRRKEEVVRLLERARAKGKGNARAKKELLTLCADFEAKNEKLLGRLLPELWQKVLDEYLNPNDLLAFALTCRFFREKQKDLGWKMETELNHLRELRKSGKVASHTLGWFQWVCDTLNIMPGFVWPGERVKGAVYEGDLVNYAAFQGSVEILRWLVEKKRWELNRDTGWWAGAGGSIEVLEYLGGGGVFEREGSGLPAFDGAARGGRLEALKFLRGLDPPCPWDGWICRGAAKGGHLEALKWLRAQEPPCPWGRRTCREEASEYDHQHVVKWIDQQEDESDVELSDLI